jgi:TRAP-type mannitol/chloroaromatic compound transport system substrate-binding protein
MMKRRQWLKGAFAAAVATTACTKSKVDGLKTIKKKFQWRLVLVIPKTLPIWGPAVVRFAEKLKIMSSGYLDIKVFGAGELVPALGTFDAVKAGQVEMGHSASYYWQGKIPASAFFTAVPFGLNANGMRAWLKGGGGQELWDELYAPHGVRSFPAGNTGLQMGGWFNRRIKSIGDYQGLKMRIPGLGGNVIERAGAKPMLVPGGEIYTNLSTGVIDATEWVGPYHDFTMGFHKAAKYYYYPGWHEPGPVLELMINVKAWQSLPNELQEMVRACAGEMDRDIYAEWLAKDGEYLQKIKDETKIEILEFPKPVLKSLATFAEQVKLAVASESPLAQKIYDSFSRFQKQFENHQRVTENAYVDAMSAHGS